ncbi:Leucyl aminopeptidase [Alteripontixanthobacter maritimus]|uniref:Probable cytosol aminopeptidase n=1 Tax=Alteripontixanthobacter maritimus TaxID=2161824 RepID=A0A369QBA0_9SPHN|nr:leucyl aminopeptidase [Alteripontixanthobacter maritimus]RDC59528.1 Leucyl aminopeptidase [Alteripontixanthobacter maritimus]
MQFTFADALPADLRTVVRPMNKGALPNGLPAHAADAADAARFEGDTGQIVEFWTEVDGKNRRQVLLGMGKSDGDAQHRMSRLEKAGAALTAKYLTSGETTLALDVSDAGLDAKALGAMLLGVRLRGWRHDVYRTTMKAKDKRSLESVTVIGAPDGATEALAEADALATGVEFTRELVTEPANVIYPASFVERCKERFDGTGAELIVLGEAEMEKLGMGSLLGVGLGSERESQILAIRWNGGKEGDAPMAFVGKGVTFDTGGISIKPGPGMEDMKWDMGGAGAVAGAMLALVTRKAKANIVGVMGLVENMPDGKAQRPGDVVKSMDGQTIEILNTDAEGRLVLADALHWTQQEFKPRAVVDFATLTGAIIITLGHEHAGLFSNDNTLADALTKAGQTSGDTVWRLPLGKAYDKLIDSPIADMKNIGGKGAGSITAAQFLQRFIAKGTPWAHCDIAGTVWTDKPGATWDKGATGFGVRLMDTYIRQNVEN